MPLPKMIALCGNPGSGKTSAAELLSELYGYVILDDGLPLRRIAVDYFGLKEHQVFTQNGKSSTVSIDGKDWIAREVLGEIGNAFEEKFSDNIIPIMAKNVMLDDQRYVIPSCRRDQGIYWKSQGAIVLEIEREISPPSPFEFDQFSRAAVDHTVPNDGTLFDLCDRLINLFEGSSYAT